MFDRVSVLVSFRVVLVAIDKGDGRIHIGEPGHVSGMHVPVQD